MAQVTVNIEIITRFEHAFRAADQATIDELCDPGLVDHNPAPDEEPTLAGFKQKVAGFKAIFPDLVEDLQDIVASGDTVATRWVVTGSQQQEFMGIPSRDCRSWPGRLRPTSQELVMPAGRSWPSTAYAAARPS
jgi:predicted ester cyclase